MLPVYYQEHFFLQLRIKASFEVKCSFDDIMNALLFLQFAFVTFHNFLNKTQVFIVLYYIVNNATLKAHRVIISLKIFAINKSIRDLI